MGWPSISHIALAFYQALEWEEVSHFKNTIMPIGEKKYIEPSTEGLNLNSRCYII